tara:strand:+ start:2072 stop:2968 length:897 start_codon:yes stop_codon:yes gene_type:complete
MKNLMHRIFLRIYLLFTFCCKIFELKNFFLLNFNLFSKQISYKVLISTPSSGSTFVRLCIMSFYEKYYHYGDGIPKHNPILNKEIFASNPVIMGDVYNQFQLNKLDYYSKLKNFEKSVIFFSRYPLGRIRFQLFKLEKSKFVILIRDFLDQIISTAVKSGFENLSERRSLDILEQKIMQYNKYISYWAIFVQKSKRENFIVINFDSISLNPVSTMSNILKFYDYPIDLDIIKFCVTTHSKENTKKRTDGLDKPKYKRFVVSSKKEFAKEEIKTYLEKHFLFKNIKKNYHYLLEMIEQK